MNRQLKFRFWNPSTGEMSFSHDDATIWNGLLVCEGDTVAMQFTGAHDQEGTEIYEDDIILLEYREGTTGLRGEKIPLKILLQVSYFSHHTHFSAVPVDGTSGSYSVNFSGSAVKTFKVIGNIFEHRHLLEK